jgi:hypothetical protein
VDLGPGEGRLFAVLPEAVGKPAVKGPAKVAKGEMVSVGISVAGTSGNPFQGRVPLEVTIRNSQGAKHDYSDYAVARDGKASVRFPIALNEPSGHWSVRVRELYGGAAGRAFLSVAPVP